MECFLLAKPGDQTTCVLDLLALDGFDYLPHYFTDLFLFWYLLRFLAGAEVNIKVLVNIFGIFALFVWQLSNWAVSCNTTIRIILRILIPRDWAAWKTLVIIPLHFAIDGLLLLLFAFLVWVIFAQADVAEVVEGVIEHLVLNVRLSRGTIHLIQFPLWAHSHALLLTDFVNVVHSAGPKYELFWRIFSFGLRHWARSKKNG